MDSVTRKRRKARKGLLGLNVGDGAEGFSGQYLRVRVVRLVCQVRQVWDSRERIGAQHPKSVDGKLLLAFIPGAGKTPEKPAHVLWHRQQAEDAPVESFERVGFRVNPGQKKRKCVCADDLNGFLSLVDLLWCCVFGWLAHLGGKYRAVAIHSVAVYYVQPLRQGQAFVHGLTVALWCRCDGEDSENDKQEHGRAAEQGLFMLAHWIEDSISAAQGKGASPRLALREGLLFQ